MNETTAAAEYMTGKYSIAALAEKYGISKGKMYYILRDNGCSFYHKRKKPVSVQERENRSKAYKGRVISEEQRKKISENNSCNYNGLNGYGHTKKHNKGDRKSVV